MDRRETLRRAHLTIVVAVLLSGASCSDDDTSPGSGTSAGAATSTTAPPTSSMRAATTAPVVTTAPTPSTAAITSPPTVPSSTAPEVVDTGLVLSADGLGLFDFGTPYDDVVATLTDVVGPPDDAPERPTFPVDDLCRDTGDYCPIATARWRHLRLQFRAIDDGDFRFSGYEFGADLVPAPDGSLDVQPWRPAPWERGVATAEGLTVGSPTPAVIAQYPELWMIVCGEPDLARLEVGETDQVGQFGFVERRAGGLYLFPPFKGALRRIGAMDKADASICEGG